MFVVWMVKDLKRMLCVGLSSVGKLIVLLLNFIFSCCYYLLSCVIFDVDFSYLLCLECLVSSSLVHLRHECLSKLGSFSVAVAVSLAIVAAV